MNLITQLSGIARTLTRFTARDREFAAAQEQMRRQRAELDERLRGLTRATLDGEREWFLDLVERDPECAVKIASSCSGGAEATDN